MKKSLFRSGTGWAFFMPKTIIELLDLNPEKDQIEITIENKTMIVKKAEN